MKLLRIHLADVPDDLHSSKKRLESFAFDHVQLRASAEFAGKFVKGWLKIIFAKGHTPQIQRVQIAAEILCIYEWCSKNFEWPHGAATFRNVCALEQTHARVNGRSRECRHVG